MNTSELKKFLLLSTVLGIIGVCYIFIFGAKPITQASYTDPQNQTQADWSSVSGVSQILNKPTLGTAATQATAAFATAAQGTLAASALQPSGSGALLTGLTSGQMTTALGFTPYNATNPSSYVASAGARTAVSLTTTGTSGTATYNNSTGVFNVPVIPTVVTSPYKTYQAIVSQSGTSAPTSTVYNNDFGATTFTWARTSAGLYTLTASAPTFTSAKTALITSIEGNSLSKYYGAVNSTTQITLDTSVSNIVSLILTAVLTDGQLTNTLVEVRVYN